MLAKNSLFNHNKKLQDTTKKELTGNGQALFNRIAVNILKFDFLIAALLFQAL